MKLALVWCIIVTVFTWCGWAYHHESAILFGGLGVGVATCFAVGVGLLSLAHTRAIGKIEAIVWLAVSSVVSPIFTVAVTVFAANIMGAPRGEGWMAAELTATWAVTIAGGTFLMFTPIVIGIGKSPRQPRE